MKRRNICAAITILSVHVIAKGGLDFDHIRRTMDQFENETRMEANVLAIIDEDDEPCVTQLAKIPPSECQIPSPQPHHQYTTTITHAAASGSMGIDALASLTSHKLYQSSTKPAENFLLQFLKDPKKVSDQ